ncbi:hypothetical protein SprV_0802628200 [Sparganum proliferum]
MFHANLQEMEAVVFAAAKSVCTQHIPACPPVCPDAGIENTTDSQLVNLQHIIQEYILVFIQPALRFIKVGNRGKLGVDTGDDVDKFGCPMSQAQALMSVVCAL